MTQNSTQKTLLFLLNGNNYGSYSKVLARKIGLLDSIFIGYLVYRHQYLDEETEDWDGWIELTHEAVKNNLFTNRKPAEGVLKNLIELGLIEKKTKGCPPKNYYRLNIEKIFETLQDAPDGQINMSKMDKLKCPKRTNWSLAPSHTLPNKDIKKEKKEISCPASPPIPDKSGTTGFTFSKGRKYSEKAYELSEKLWSKIKGVHPNHKPPKIENWAREVDLMIRIDNRDPDEINAMIDYCFEHDPFWVKTLQSAEKLRKHFDAIYPKMHPPENKGVRLGKNRGLAHEIKSCIKDLPSVYNNFLIGNECVINRATQEEVPYTLSPQDFEYKVLKLFKLKRDL